MLQLFREQLKYLLKAAPLLILALGIFAIIREIESYQLSDFTQVWHSIPNSIVAAAVCLTILNYLILACYDWLGLKYARQTKVPLRAILFTSFLSWGISNTTGHAWASGGSVRYRYYSAHGVPGWDIAKLSFFMSITFMAGLLTLGLVTGLSLPWIGPESFHSPHTINIATVLCAGALALFWAAVLSWQAPLKIRGLDIRLPTPRMAAAQTLLACVDILLASLVLWVFIKDVPGISFEIFIVMFVMAQIIGLVSQVPGGLGVFEGTFLWISGPALVASHPQLVAGLLLYRIIYYILPLLIAGILLVKTDLLQSGKHFARFGKIAGNYIPSLVPQVFAILLFLAGGLLLVSGATPALPEEMRWLREAIPLPIVEISHFTSSLVGVLLLFLARGIRFKLDAAWYGSLILLALGITASLLKGLDWQEASVLVIMFTIMALSRRHFYRKSSLLTLTFTPTWIFMIFSTLALTTWLGFFSFRHVEYANDLWWQFSYRNDASRFLRSLVILCIAAIVLIVRQLLAPRPANHEIATEEDFTKALSLIRSNPDTQSNLALLGDKSFFWGEDSRAFMSYKATPRYWIAMGDPVGDEAAFEALLWSFREEADRHGAHIVLYQTSDKYLPLYLDLGLVLLKLGEEAKVYLPEFSLQGQKKDNLRGGRNKILKQGYTFHILNLEETRNAIPRLKLISESWMSRKKVKEKGFSLGFFAPDYIARGRTAIVRDTEGHIIAFANLWETDTREELSLDLMRYAPNSARGIMDFLFAELMLWGKEQGYRWFSLGMAPLAGMERHALAPLWHKIGSVIFALGEDLYNFEGLRSYKAKFDPVWRPRYLAAPAGLSAPLVLIAVARLISGGFKGIFAK